MSSNNENNNLPAKRHDLTISQPGSLLDSALSKLPVEQQKALMQKAIEKRLDLDVDATRAAHRFQASSADMANTIRHIRDVQNSTESDYTLRADYETASGRTHVEIKKSNNTVIIVIAIVIGIATLMMFSK
jgi:hypothetical protein